MLVQRDSHFNIANMENEVYSERSMSMHSLCSILFSCCLIRSVIPSSAAAPSFNKHSLKAGRDWNFVDTASTFDSVYLIP